MGEELSDSEDIYIVFGSINTYGNSFDNLEETLPSLVAYLARGPPSDPDQHPEPLGGWEFPFEPSLLEWLVEDLEIEEKDRISLIADYQHHLLFHPEEVSSTEHLEITIQHWVLELLLVQEAIHLAKQLILSVED